MNKKVKEFLKNLGRRSRLEYIETLLKEIIFYFQVKRAGKDIVLSEFRHLRVNVLSHFISRLHRAMRQVDYHQKLLITPDEDYIFLEGVLLSMKRTIQYLKFSGALTLNQGKMMYDFLKTKGIEINSLIDLGANWGEVSLYFSLKNPAARILAVEASTDNFEILKSNCEIQTFNTANIICLNEAVSDKKGQIEISKGKGSQNTTLKGYWDTDMEIVPCDTLSSFIKRFNFDSVDFLKIDIEGAEPVLLQSLKENIYRIRSILIEIGGKSSHEQYIPVLRLFWDNGMKCCEWLCEEPISTFGVLEKYVMNKQSLDLWFFK